MDALGRQHPVEKTFQAYQWIRQAGFESVNLDLLFGAPGQSLQDWEDDLAHAVELGPDHLSTYCLTFEEDTAMFVRLSQGKVKIDPSRKQSFANLPGIICPAGLISTRYPTMPSRHACYNLAWAMNEWIGIGPSPYEYKVRWKTLPTEEWAEGIRQPAKVYREEVLSFSDFAQDAVLFGLRMNQGHFIPIIAKFRCINRSILRILISDRLVSEDYYPAKFGNYALWTGKDSTVPSPICS